MGIDDTSLLFVYGTLKRNQPNHYLIQNVSGNKFVRYKFDGQTVSKYPLIISTQFNIPFLLNEPGEGKVYGEVYEVNESMLNFLDEFEGVPDLYQRLLIGVRPFNKSLQSGGEEKDIIKTYAYMRNIKIPNKLSGDHQGYLEVYDNSNTTLKYVPHTEVGIDELI